MRRSILRGAHLVTSMHQQRSLPLLPGAVFTAQELIYFFGHSSHHQVNDGCDRGEYTRLEHGIFMVAGEELTLQAVLTFCARRYPYLHVGGKTALIWRGLIPPPEVEEPVVIYGTTGTIAPHWIAKRFPIRLSSRCPFNRKLPRQAGLEPLPDQPDGIPVSVPERALIEYLDQEGAGRSAVLTLESVRRTMEAMRDLQPDVLASLFKHCFRPRILRMCAIWAEELQMPWLRVAREALPKRFKFVPNSLALPDEDGKKHWLKPPSSASVVRQTNKLANSFLEMMGKKFRDGYRFDLAQEPQEVLCWRMACQAQKILLATNVEKALVTTRRGNKKGRRKYALKQKALTALAKEALVNGPQMTAPSEPEVTALNHGQPSR